MTEALYLIGGPGTGKSTVMKLFLDEYQEIGPYVRLTKREMMGHYLYDNPVGSATGLYLGKVREQFPGTDGLCMSVHPHAMEWAEAMLPIDTHLTMVFGEGSRLATERFLTALSAGVTRLAVVRLVADWDVMISRVRARPDSGDWQDRKAGKRTDKAHQAEQYLKVSTTKAANLAHKLPGVITIDTTHITPETVKEAICLI